MQLSSISQSWWALLALLVATAAAGCDDTKAVDGARGRCAVGGAINGCDATTASIYEACNKLVDCGAIPVDGEDDGDFDWGRCVDQLEQRQSDQVRFVSACVAASACDELRTNGSPNNPFGRIPCLSYGER